MSLGQIDTGTLIAISSILGAILGAGGVGAILIAWLNNRPKLRVGTIARAKLDAENDRTATEEWRLLFNEARADLNAIRVERERIEQSYYGLLGLFVQFRNHVSNEVSDIGVLLDRKELEPAQVRLAALGRHVSKLRFPHEEQA